MYNTSLNSKMEYIKSLIKKAYDTTQHAFKATNDEPCMTLFIHQYNVLIAGVFIKVSKIENIVNYRVKWFPLRV